MSKPLTYRLSGPGKIDFSFTPAGGPIDDSGPEARTLFEKLGRAHAAWARMEFLLDAILLHVNKKSESTEMYDPHHAFGFKNKVDLLKKWLDHPKLVADKKMNQQFLSTMKKLANTRNEIFHSHLKDYDPKKKTFQLQSCEFKGNDTFRVAQGEKQLKALDVFTELANGSTLGLTEIAGVLFNKVD